jgi:hypothetical protein
VFGDESEEEQEKGECAVAHVDWGPHPLNDRVRKLVCAQVRFHFAEQRPLFLAGKRLNIYFTQLLIANFTQLLIVEA